MCGICGCSEANTHEHEHEAGDMQHHHHEHASPDIIAIEQDILAKNNRFAGANRAYFSKNHIVAINLMSSPGSGKTTLLTKTITDLKHKREMAVVVGDQQTDYDAKMLQTTGVPAIQVNTGHVCHLDAHRVGHAVGDLSLSAHALLFIENVGNLVCPALFDLGETFTVVILSVTEGDNKPLKYPDMFRNADLMILTKIDLLPYVNFDVSQCIANAKIINPSLEVFNLSATSGSGLACWYEWLLEKQQ